MTTKLQSDWELVDKKTGFWSKTVKGKTAFKWSPAPPKSVKPPALAKPKRDLLIVPLGITKRNCLKACLAHLRKQSPADMDLLELSIIKTVRLENLTESHLSNRNTRFKRVFIPMKARPAFKQFIQSINEPDLRLSIIEIGEL